MDYSRQRIFSKGAPTVRNTVKPVNLAQNSGILARSMGQVANDLGNIGNTLADMKQQKDRQSEEDAVNKFNEYVMVCENYAQSNVYNKVGFDTKENGLLANNFFTENRAKYGDGLTGTGAEKFGRLVDQYNHTQNLKINSHTYSQVKTATINGNNSALETLRSNYAVTGNAKNIESALEIGKETYTLTQGSAITQESIDEFDKDTADGSWTLPNNLGELKIIEDGEPKEGEITRKQLNEKREQLLTAKANFDKSQQDIVDVFYGEALDNYVNNNRYDKATAFLKSVDPKNEDNQGKRTLSPKVFSKANEIVDRKKTVFENYSLAQSYAKDIEAAHGKYGSDTQEADHHDFMADIRKYFDKDPERAERVVALYGRYYNELKAKQNATLQKDISGYLNNWTNNKSSMSEVLKEIETLDDDRLKSSLQAYYDRATKYEKTPSVQVAPLTAEQQGVNNYEMEKFKNSIKLQALDGRVTLDNVEYDLSDREQLEALVSRSGLPDKERTKLTEYLLQGNEQIPIHFVYDKFLEVSGLNMSRTEAVEAYPQLASMVDYFKGNEVFESATARDKFLGDAIGKILQLTVRTDRWGYDKGAFVDRPNFTYMTDKDLEVAAEAKNEFWLMRHGNGAPRTATAEEFAKATELEKRDGRYVTTPKIKGVYGQ